MLINYTERVNIDTYDLISYAKTDEPDITLEELGDNLDYYVREFLSTRYYINSDNVDPESIDAIWEELKEIWDD